jgi:hypothetical protein
MGDASAEPDRRIALLRARVRQLEALLSQHEPEPAVPFDEPQRRLSPEEVEQETRRLLAVCAAQGVAAVAAEAVTCPELLRSLAEACYLSGLREAGQYLHYLEHPYD